MFFKKYCSGEVNLFYDALSPFLLFMTINPFNGSYDDPVYYDDSGGYITRGQLKFFLNRRNGSRHFVEGSDKFFEYYSKCVLYNIVSDCLNSNSGSASLSWDSKKEAIAFTFPETGEVAARLFDMGWDTSSFKRKK